MTLFASWNGATEVTSWQVLAGSRPDRLTAVASVRTATYDSVVCSVIAVSKPFRGTRHRSGRTLGASKMVRLRK